MDKIKEGALEPIYRLPDVERFTGLKKSSIYSGIRNKTFPEGVKLGPRLRGWTHSSLLQWQRARIADSNT